jgi:hypothetical protein
MDQNFDKGWDNFENGRTIGTKGAEEGIIIVDLENINGARITVERDGATAPFAITFGIYGLLFHTYFKSLQTEVDDTVNWLKSKINEVFDMYELPEEQRTDEWYHEHDRLVHELTID